MQGIMVSKRKAVMKGCLAHGFPWRTYELAARDGTLGLPGVRNAKGRGDTNRVARGALVMAQFSTLMVVVLA